MFKKSLSIALAIALGLSVSPVEALANIEGQIPSVEQGEVVAPEGGQSPDAGTDQGVEEVTPTPADQFEFDGKGTIIKYNGSDDVVVIPEQIDGVTVTSIGKEAFLKNATIKKVVFNEGLVSIGENAFKECKLLAEIQLSSTIRELGKKAFYKSIITDVVLNEGLENVGEYAFNGCSKLANVQFSSTVKTIGKAAFKQTSISNLVLNEGLTDIADEAFGGCKNLTNVHFSSTIKRIGKMSFAINSITDLVLNEGLEEIGEKAFSNIITLKSVKLPDSLVKIDNLAFACMKRTPNESLTSISFGPNVKHVGHKIFEYCNGIKNYEIAPNGVKIELHDDIFINTTSLNIPQGREVFLFARAFENEVEPIELNLGTINVNSFDEKEVLKVLNEKVKLTTGCAKIDTSVPDNSKDILIENDGVNWGDLSKLDENAESINLVGKFKSIPTEKYEAANALEMKAPTEKHLPKYNINVTLVKNDDKWTSADFTYGECHYTALPEGKYFGIKGLSDSGKEKLKEEKTLFIPKYIKVTENGVKKQKLVEGIGQDAFRELGIEKVVFPSNIDGKKDYVIDASAFLGNNISKLDIPNYVKYIDSAAFKGNKLASLYVPASVLKIGNNSFEGNNISNLEFSDDVEKIQIDNFSFVNNQIKEVHLPYSIFKLLGEVFEGNPGLNKGKVYLYTRNPEHFKSETYIKANSNYHQFTLKGKNVNREELHKKISEANKLDSNEYIEESWNTFTSVLNDIKKVFKNEDSTQEDIDNAYKSLNEAFSKLDSKGVNKRELRALVASVEDLRKDLYESKSWNNLINAYIKAELILNDLNTNQSEVDKAKNSLQDAINSLVVDENMKYNVSDFTFDGTVVTGYSESGKKKFAANKDLVIPDVNNKGEKITEIGKIAFETTDGVIMGTDIVKSPEGLTSVKIPSTVKKIGEGAFRSNALEKITLPNKLEEIGMQAFNGNKLVNVSIPDSVKNIGGGAFSANDKMKSIKLSKGMDVVPAGICSRNLSLEYIEIPSNVKVIGASAFQGAPLKKLTIPSNVVEIQDRAFSTNRLEVVKIPGNVKKIGRLAFENNKKFRTTKKVILEEGIEEIGSNVFKSCLIEEAKLPNSLKKLDKSAFKDNMNDKQEVIITKLYTNNKEHLNFEDPKDTFEIIFKEAPVEPEKPIIPSEPSVPSEPSKPEEKPEKPEKPEEKPEEGVQVEVVDKIAGENRYETSLDISQEVYSSSQKVYLVSGEKFPDALSSAALAGKGDGPILLINDQNIDKILEEINRLGAKEIVFVGGNSISKANEAKIKEFAEAKSSVVSAFAGENRYETAIKVAEETIAKLGNKGKVIIADGRNYPDAVSIASYSSKEGIPVILVNGNKVPDEVKSFLNKHKIKEAIIVGGTKAVGKDVEKLFSNFERIAGEDRYDTSKKIAERFFADSDTIFVASGESFADSLSVSYYAGKKHSPILLTKANSLDNDTRDFLNANKDKNYIIVGGDKAVNPGLFQ